jgi:hypothetical protein
VHDQIEEGAKDGGTCELELPPELPAPTAAVRRRREAMTPVRALPREERELMIAANNGYVLAFDNLSGLPAWLSDGFAGLSALELDRARCLGLHTRAGYSVVPLYFAARRRNAPDD